MDQDKIIERITTLEANQSNMKDQMRRFEDKQDELANNMNKLSECVIRIEGKIDNLQNVKVCFHKKRGIELCSMPLGYERILITISDQLQPKPYLLRCLCT